MEKYETDILLFCRLKGKNVVFQIANVLRVSCFQQSAQAYPQGSGDFICFLNVRVYDI